MSDLQNSFDLYIQLTDAIRQSEVDTINGILEGGFDINFFPQGKPSALAVAVFSSTLEVIELLLEYGADPALSEYIALRYAFDRNGDILATVLSYCPDPNVNVEHPNVTPLHIAVKNNLPEIVQYLLENGADPTICTTHYEKSALTIACENRSSYNRNNIEIARMLLEYGAHVDHQDHIGNSPLIKASHVGNEEIVSLLIENGADLTARNFHGFTALHRLLDKGFVQEETIQMFFDSGIDVNDTSNDGSCLLSCAAANSCSEPFQYLLQCGANINNLVNNNDNLIEACSNGHPKTVKFLLYSGLSKYVNTLDKGFPHGTALHKAVNNINHAMAIVKLLLEYGADVNLKDASNSTPLHQASYRGNNEVVKLLLLHGADVNAKDEDEITPLQQASSTNRVKVVSELLYYDADVNVKYSIDFDEEEEEETPLNLLVERQKGNLYAGNECLCIFVSHIALKILKKQFIDKLNIDLMNKEVVRYFVDKCNEEIEKMTKMNIRGTSVTLYDFLMKNVVTLAKVLGNTDVQDGFTSDFDLPIEFPMYEWYLVRKYYDSLDRSKIIRNVMKIFRNNIYPLPHACMHTVLDFLSFQDLRNISRCVPPHNYDS